MSSITPGVNVPDRSIGEGSAAASVFEAFGVDMEGRPRGSIDAAIGHLVRASCSLVGWVSASATHHESAWDWWVALALTHPTNYADASITGRISRGAGRLAGSSRASARRRACGRAGARGPWR